MSVDRSVFQAPRGITALAAEEEPIEVIIQVEGEEEPEEEEESDFGENLAEHPDIEKELGGIASELLRDYEEDINSRKDWMDTYVKGLKLLGLKYEDRTEPWAGATGVYHPLLMESAVRFQSETIME